MASRTPILITKFKPTATSKDVSDYLEQVRILEMTFDDVVENTHITRM